MDQNTIADLHVIFGNTLTGSLMDELIHHLDKVTQPHELLLVKTRNDKNQILSFRDTSYFSIIHRSKFKPVITAGAGEVAPNGGRSAVMRFLDTNPQLASVPPEYRFPYKKPKWTNVEIRSETISLFPKLLKAEIDNFLLQLNQRNSESSPEFRDEQKATWGVVSMILGFVFLFGATAFDDVTIVILIAIVGILLIIGGGFAKLMFGKSAPESFVPRGAQSTDEVRCSRCGSTQITVQKRGFKIGRAVGVGVATGIVGGLLAGGVGKDDVIIVCLKCGHQWKP